MKLSKIAQLLQAELIGDRDIEITGLAPIEKAMPGEITFISNVKYKRYLHTTKASAAIVPLDIVSAPISLIKTENPYLAYAQVAKLFYKWPYEFKGISPKAFIGQDVQLGKGVSVYPLAYIDNEAQIGSDSIIFPGVYIGPRVKIGRKTIIYANAAILADCEIGNRVIIHSGAVIGSDGFGFVSNVDGKHIKIPQLGTVQIEDDVEIGANTTIDRAALGKTLIKKGTKIDNLVQIAHNVQIGEDSLIIAQVGIAGSTKIGNKVTLAGQVGVVGHVHIGNQAKVGAKTGVAKSVPSAAIVASGVPAMPYQTYLKTMAALPKLPELLKKIKLLEKELSTLKDLIGDKNER